MQRGEGEPCTSDLLHKRLNEHRRHQLMRQAWHKFNYKHFYLRVMENFDDRQFRVLSPVLDRPDARVLDLAECKVLLLAAGEKASALC